MEQDNGTSGISDAGILVSAKQAAGAFAMWAIRQSPYDHPGQLPWAVAKFIHAWPTDVYGFRRFRTQDALYEEIKRICEGIPEVLAWNAPKSGHDAEMVFVSRYGGPDPDDDFIDLYALWGNTARTIWDEEIAAQGCAQDTPGDT